MKNFILLAGWILLLVNAAFAQRSERVLLRGCVIGNRDAELIPLANLLNLATGQRAISNRQGYFKIMVSPGDSLKITAIGYDPMIVKAGTIIPVNPGDTVKLMVTSKSYQLKDVNIVYSSRRRDSIARLAAEVLKNDPLLNNYDRVLKRPRGGFDNGGLSGVITEMYYQFSKEGQDMVHFEEFLAYSLAQKEVDKKYNREIVQKIANVPDAYLDEVVMHCRPTREFTLKTPEYDLLVYIKNCSDEFKRKKGIGD